MAGERQLSPRAVMLQRVYILAVLSFGSFAQGLAWFMYSSVDVSKFLEYYRGAALPQDALSTFADEEIRVLINWGPIAGVLFFPLQTWLLGRPGGLRKTVLVGLGLGAVSAIFRMLPSVAFTPMPTMPDHAVRVTGSQLLTRAILHFAQLINGIAGPFVMGCVSRLAVVWFPEDQRVTATAIGATSNCFGNTVAFLLGPGLVPESQKYPAFLLTVTVMQILPCLCAMVYYPDAPAQPPSAAAAAWQEVEEEPAGFVEGIRLALSNRSYAFLVLAAGVLGGSGAAWQAVLHDTLQKAKYSDKFIGDLGFFNALGMNLGAVAGGSAAGTKTLQRRFKLVLIVSTSTMLAAGVAWSLLCTTPGLGPVLILLVLVMGLAAGMAAPFFYELGAELTYPAHEASSAGVLVLLLNLTVVVMVFLPQSLNSAMNWIYLMCMFGSLLLVVTVREQYLRPTSHTTCEGLETTGSSMALRLTAQRPTSLELH